MKYVCPVCGYIHEGDNPPAECPVCHVSGDKFKAVEGELKLAAEHEYGVYAKTVKNNDNIINTVSDYFSISTDEITSKRRTSNLVLPRQICMYLCKELTQSTYQEIADALKRKDHTTVMYGIDKITDEILVDKSLSTKIESLKKLLNP